MNLKWFSLLGILSILSSCIGQNAGTLSKEYSIDKELNYAVGDTVLGLDESIWVIFHDTKHQYWFGSDGQGVYLYDGNDLIRFSIKQGLPSDRIRGIQEDKQGHIFISTLKGICRYDGKSFVTLPAVESNNWKSNPDDLWFSLLRSGNIGGPYRYDGNTLHHLKLPKSDLEDAYNANNPNPSFSPYDVYTIYKDTRGDLWFGTSNFGACQFNGSSHEWFYEDHWTNTPEGGSFGIRSIIEDKEGDYSFCNTKHKYSIQEDNFVLSEKINSAYEGHDGIDNLKAPDGKDFMYFMSAVLDNKGDLWMATYSEGVWKYDGVKARQYPILNEADEITLFSIYKDRTDVLWLGTQKSGVYRFNGEAFEKFNP